MKRKVTFVVFILILAFFLLFLIRIRGTEYNLEEVEIDGWVFNGGTIQLKGLNREFIIDNIEYIGPDELEVSKLTLELKTKNMLGILPEETLSLSSVGASESWKIETGYTFGSVSGSTHSINVLSSYFLRSIEVHIIIDSTNGLDGVVFDVPVR